MKIHASLIAALMTGGTLAAPVQAELPAHPGDIAFPPLQFDPPSATEYRHEVNGVPVFLMPSTEFPLITVSFTFKGGAYLEDPDATGLADALGSMLRRGGTTTVPAEALDEKFDFLAANVSAFVGGESSGATVNCLESNFDEAFALFLDMLRNPGFDAERLRVYKDEQLEQMKQRNDSPMAVVGMKMSELAWGDDHYRGRQTTQASLEAITPDRMRELHGRIFHPGNLYIAATGDFAVDEMLAVIGKALDGWPRGETAGEPPAPSKSIEPGLYHADTAQADLPQGTTVLLTRTMQRDDPDVIPMAVMNRILGGGGFSSRVVNRIRSDEGLAYTAQTFNRPEIYYPGVFGGFFQSKNRTVALATKMMLEEIERMSVEPVTEEELQMNKNFLIEQFPQRFASKPAVLGTFVNDAMTDRDPEYWSTYRARVEAVSTEDVQNVAVKWLDPASIMILVVGNWDEIYPGDLEGRASMSDFFDGNVTHLPMRDPMTLEPME